MGLGATRWPAVVTIRTVTVDLLDVNESTLESGVKIAPGGTYSEQLNDAGSFDVTIPYGAAGHDDVDVGILARFTVSGGIGVDFTGRVDQVDKVVASKDKARRQVRIQGRDWVSEWDDALVTPPMGIGSLPHTKIVRWDWTHPELDTSAWTEPVYLGSLFTADLDPLGAPAGPSPGAKDGWDPKGWPDTFTGWIWGDAVDGNDSHPVDDVCYFHLTLPTADGLLVPITTIDDTGQVAFDGAIIDAGQTPPAVQWTQAWASGMRAVTSGDHTVRVRAENRAVAGNPSNLGNPAAFAAVIYQPNVSELMEFDNVIARTGANTGASDDLTDGGQWRALHNPASPPGFDAPTAIQTQLDLVQADGFLPDWTVNAIGTHTVRDDITATVNDTLLSWLRQLAERGICDWRARPGERVLDVWPAGERGDFYTTPGSPPAWTGAHLSQVDVTRRR